MELYRLLTEYVFLTSPVVEIFSVVLIIQVVLQALSPAVLMYRSIKRQSALERVGLCAFPMVFVVTYVIMDLLLGGSFLKGGFYQTEALEVFLRQFKFLREAAFLLVLFPVSAWFLGRIDRVDRRKSGTCDRGVNKTWLIMLPGNIISWTMFIFCLIGTLILAGAFSFDITELMHLEAGIAANIKDKFLLFYTYCLFAILFQVLLNITALIWHALFSERRPKGNLTESAYDDKWCRKSIARILTMGNKAFFCALFPLFLIVYVMVVPSLTEDGIKSITALLPMQLVFLPVEIYMVSMLVRICFPSLLPAMKLVDSWQPVIRRQFCHEYFNENHPPVRGSNIEITENFVVIKAALKSVLLYLPDVKNIYFRENGSKALLYDGTEVPVPPVAPDDFKIVKSSLERN